MKRLASLTLGLILSAPALAIQMPAPAPLKSIDWLPGNTVRVGQGINAVFRLATMANQVSDIWIHTDCNSQKKTLLFINTQNNKGLRVYSTNSIDRYAPGSPFEPDADSPFNTDPALDICHQNIPEPQWAELSTQNQPDIRLFVDAKNSLREGQMLKVRLAKDYDKIHFDEKYAAPYSMKIQEVMINCGKGESMNLDSFSLDNQGFVTDIASPPETKFTAFPANFLGVAKELCAIKDLQNFQGNGSLKWRNKDVADNQPTRPDFEHNNPQPLGRFPVSDEVKKVIENTVSQSTQAPAFQSLSYTQSGPDNDGWGLMARIDRQPDGTTLTIVKMTLANAVFYSQYERLFNMVDIKKWESMSEAPWVSKTLSSTLVIPPLPDAKYQSRSVLGNKEQPGKDKTISQECVTDKKWRSAADLNNSFLGRYLEFVCKGNLGDGREASSDYAYFEALRVFIRIGFHANGEAKRFTLTDVVIKP